MEIHQQLARWDRRHRRLWWLCVATGFAMLGFMVAALAGYDTLSQILYLTTAVLSASGLYLSRRMAREVQAMEDDVLREREKLGLDTAVDWQYRT